MTAEYVHQELNKEVIFLAGYYVPMEEELMDYDRKEVLVVSGKATIEASCCGSGSSSYAIVPGYVVEFKTRKNERGLDVSIVAPVKDQKERIEIAERVRNSKSVNNVEFW